MKGPLTDADVDTAIRLIGGVFPRNRGAILHVSEKGILLIERVLLQLAEERKGNYRMSQAVKEAKAKVAKVFDALAYYPNDAKWEEAVTGGFTTSAPMFDAMLVARVSENGEYEVKIVRQLGELTILLGDARQDSLVKSSGHKGSAMKGTGPERDWMQAEGESASPDKAGYAAQGSVSHDRAKREGVG